MNGLPTTSSEQLSLEDMARNLLKIFTNYEKQDRVILPLLDVLGLLYESGTLGRIEKDAMYVPKEIMWPICEIIMIPFFFTNFDFAYQYFSHNNILICVKKECFKSKNIRKLLSATKVYSGMTSLQGSQVKIKALQQMLSYLLHAFPRVTFLLKKSNGQKGVYYYDS